MAGGSAGSIFVDMILRDASFRGGLNNARNQTRGFANQAASDLGRARQAFVGVLSPIDNISNALSRMAGVFAGALSVQRIVQYSDTWRQLSGRLSLVAGDMESLGATQQALFDIAQRTRQPLEGVYNLYTRLAQAVPEAQRAQYDLLGVTESINAALAITGEGSAQASSAILQFTQAVASGFKGSGQEINALLDSAPRLAQALQRSFGDGQTSLKELAKNGKLDLDVIFRALSGVGEEGQKLREEFAKLPPTVGQAFTQLNNAFLVFIGNSDAANEGTSALALGVQSLAKNLDLLAEAGIAIGGVMAARVAIGFLAATQQTIAYQIALGRLAGVSAAAVTGQLALGGAVTASSRALALLGGPVGVLALVAFGLYQVSKSSSDLVPIQQKYNEQLFEAERLSLQSATATGKAKIALDEKKKTILDTARAEMELARSTFVRIAAEADAAGAGNRSALDYILDPAAAGRADALASKADDALQRMKLAGEQFKNIFGAIEDNSSSIGGGNPIDKLDESSKKLVDTQKQLAALYEKNRTIITGLDQSTFDYTQTLTELQTLREKGLLTEQQHVEAIANLDRAYQENKEVVNDWGINIEELGKSAATNIQSSFADFLFDPFAEGLDGMLLGFVKTLQRMLAEAAAANLAKQLFGTGGGNSNIFASLANSALGRSLTLGSGVQGPIPQFGGFFAEGGNLRAGEWGIAGENGPEMIYGGTTGKTIYPNDMMGGGNSGNTYQIDARGADQGAVNRLEKALITLAGPGVIEKRVLSAQQRGAL